MDFHINPQQREMVESVRALAQTEFKPTAGKWMDGTFPWPNMKKLAELGVLGMTVPEDYGGLGLSQLAARPVLTAWRLLRVATRSGAPSHGLPESSEQGNLSLTLMSLEQGFAAREMGFTSHFARPHLMPAPRGE